MASTPTPIIHSFRAGGTIVKGHAVKIGADAQHVVECTAATDKAIGIANNDASTDGAVEVCLPGGGAEGKAQGTIAAGKLVVSHTDGTLKAVATAGDRLVGFALDTAAAGDLFPVFVVAGQAYQTES